MLNTCIISPNSCCWLRCLERVSAVPKCVMLLLEADDPALLLMFSLKMWWVFHRNSVIKFYLTKHHWTAWSAWICVKTLMSETKTCPVAVASSLFRGSLLDNFKWWFIFIIYNSSKMCLQNLKICSPFAAAIKSWSAVRHESHLFCLKRQNSLLLCWYDLWLKMGVHRLMRETDLVLNSSYPKTCNVVWMFERPILYISTVCICSTGFTFYKGLPAASKWCVWSKVVGDDVWIAERLCST